MSWLSDVCRIFRRKTLAEMASSDLADAELLRLQHQTAQELSAAMTNCLDIRIKRLKSFLKQQGEQI